MGSLFLSIAFVLFFAWVSRALIGARELTWRRTILAALAGILFGQTIGALLLIRDLDQIGALSGGEITRVGLPFTLIGTMAAIVVLELLFTGPPARRGLRLIRPMRALRRRVGIIGRGWEVSRILVRHGLAPLLGLRRGEVSARSPGELARRIRIALEEAGGMFIKLGQLLATRPDLLPPVAQTELTRLQASAAPLGREEVEQALSAEIGQPLEDVFSHIDWQPLGSASIAQAHAARLLDGREVVVKVRRPGLEKQVEIDLAIARWLARTAERKTEWGHWYEVSSLVAEFSEVLRGELDFHVEARHALEAAAALESHPRMRAPGIVDSLSTERILVMERLAGEPLSRAPHLDPTDARAIADALCTSQVEAMLNGKRFHGDPHPGNVMLLDDVRLGLIDFGIAGRLDSYERASVLQILIALKLEQPTLLYEAMVSIGAVSPDRDPQEIERALAQFLATHLSSGLPSPEALTDLLRLAAELRMRLPRSTTTMFRALATLAGTLEQISPGYPLIDVVADIGGAELRGRMAPGSASELIKQEWAQLGPLLQRAPRHIDRIATLLEHGRLTTRLRLFTDTAEVAIVERLVNRVVLTLLSIGTGIVSVMLLSTPGGPALRLVDTSLFEMLGWTGLTLAVILLLRVLLAVLRTDSTSRR